MKSELFRNFILFKKDQFVYATKRKKITKNIFVTTFAILLALVVSLLIVVMVYGEGNLFVDIIVQIFTSPFNQSNWKLTIGSITIFVVSALSFIFANRAGMFNIGISGQMLFGAQIAIMIAWCMPNIPNGIGQLLVLMISIICGGLVAMLIGALKIYFNINEVISSIMLNWIIFFLGTMIINNVGTSLGRIDSSGLYTTPLSNNLSLIIDSDNSIFSGAWLPLLITMLIVLILSIVILNWLTFGKKISCSGMGPNASLYAGMNVKKNQLITMAISGGLAGLLGAMLYCGQNNSISVTIAAKAIPVEGFNGISVGLIAMNNPAAVLPVSCLFGMIQNSKSSIQQICGVDPNIADLMFGIIVYGAAIVSLFFLIKPWIWYKKIRYGKQSAVLYITHLGDIEKEMEKASTAIFYVKHIHKMLNKSYILSKKIEKLQENIDQDQLALINKFIKEYNEIMNFSYSMVQIGKRIFKITISNEQKQEAARKLESTYKKLNSSVAYEILELFNKMTSINQTINDQLEMTQIKNVFETYKIDVKKLNDKSYFKKCKQTILETYHINKAVSKIEFLNSANKKRYEDYQLKNLKILTNDYNKTINQKLTKVENDIYKAYAPLIKQTISFDQKWLKFKNLSFRQLQAKKSADAINKNTINEIKIAAKKQQEENLTKLNSELKTINDCNLAIKNTLAKIKKQEMSEIDAKTFILDQKRQLNLSYDLVRRLKDYSKQLNRIDQIIKYKQKNGYDLALCEIKKKIITDTLSKVNNKNDKEVVR